MFTFIQIYNLNTNHPPYLSEYIRNLKGGNHNGGHSPLEDLRLRGKSAVQIWV